MAALLVDHGTLLVHHVVVLQEVLTDTEVVLLHLALCTLDALADHWTLDTLAVLEAQAVHHLGNTLRGEETHQFVLQRYIEDRRAWVALTTGTTTQLAVYTAALMALGTNDGKTACCLHLWGELDISTTTCHVGGDGDSTLAVGRASCLGYDLSLLLVELGIEHIVRNIAHLEHLAQQF